MTLAYILPNAAYHAIPSGLFFYPRDAMIARVVVCLSVCPSVSVSVTSRSSVETDEGIELLSTCPTLYCKEIWVYPK